jgi:hypothetical protein
MKEQGRRPKISPKKAMTERLSVITTVITTASTQAVLTHSENR